MVHFMHIGMLDGIKPDHIKLKSIFDLDHSFLVQNVENYFLTFLAHSQGIWEQFT